ncbi:MAG TPA: transcription termination factor Rho [Planctomycetota bacterium]|nr:transcription termination factor Rho [Planctomycetota bacterium]
MSISENEFTAGMDPAPDHGGPERKRWRGGRRRRRRRGGGGGGGGGFGGNGGGNGGGGFGGNGGGGFGGAEGGDARGDSRADARAVVEGPTEEASGLLEYTKEGNGWLRKKQNSYMPDSIPNGDVFVPSALIRTHRLQEGSEIKGQAGMPSRGPQRLTLSTVEEVDAMPPDERRDLKAFRELTVIDPEPMFVLAPGDDDISLRIVDLLCPLGRGQRGLVVAPPRSGKTVLMQKICHAIAEAYPEVHMMVLLIDERPEEATGWKRSVEGPNREVLVSTLDEGPKHHIAVSDVCLKRAQRLVETGRDVVILLDSITRLTRAYNSFLGGRGGGTMSGGLGAKVLEVPKKFFGSARNCEEGGSLTILATTLVDTGSRMDQVIFEEFKGTGNMELVLNRQLAERRIFPAIDIELSGTRKEELLLGADVTKRLYTLRRVLARMNALDAMPLLIDRLMKTDSNKEFLDSFRLEE